MKVTSTLIAAAAAGIMSGTTSYASTSGEIAPTDSTMGATEMKKGPPKKKDKKSPSTAKHACKGQNGCKNQGGCKTDKNACQGQNACKGQGGCKVT